MPHHSDQSRREFISTISFAATAVFGASSPRVVWPSRHEEDVIVETAYGKIRGVRAQDVSIFRGVPYAGTVSGERRFRRPAQLQSWTGVRDALRLGSPSIQPGRETPRGDEPLPSEDCLVLNVWTPGTDSRRRPVMFYSHGGGFVTGSGGSRGQDGANLARNFDVVVVETNHRLGLLGFLFLDDVAGNDYAGSGNNGILDIVDALRWVRQNIEAFGGDRSNVMIFGESGGGGKTSCLYAMPSAAQFFNKASIESGPGVRMMTREGAAATTARVLQQLNVAPSGWRRLLELSTPDLLRLQTSFPPAPPNQPRTARSGPGGFGPVVDGTTLPAHPFDPTAPAISRDKPLIVGWNEDEYTFFAWERKDSTSFNLDFDGLRARLEPRFSTATARIIETYRASRPKATPTDIYVAVQSVTMMGLGSIEIAEKKAAQGGASVYLYNFGYKSESKIPGTDYAMGTPHAMDIAFKFNNVGTPSFFSGARPERLAASHNMAEMWTTFARTGRPAAVGQPAWPAYDHLRRPTMRIDTTCEVIEDRHRAERELWKELGYIG